MSTSPSAIQDRPPAFGAFPFVLLILCLGYYLVFYVISGMFQHPGLWPRPAPHEIYGYTLTPLGFTSFALLGAGIDALIAGYFLGIHVFRAGRHRVPAFKPSLLEPTGLGALRDDFLFLLCSFNVVAVAAFYLLGLHHVPVLYQLSHSALFFSLGVVRHGQITQSVSRTARGIGYGALLFLFLALVPLRQGTLLFLLVLFLGVLEIIYGRYRWLVWGIVFALILSVYPFKRVPLPIEILKICSPETKVEPPLTSRYLLPTIEKCTTNSARVDLIAAGISWGRDQVLRRISTIRLLDRVVTETPARVPFFNGETLRPLLFAPIPRFLWPDKPRENIGNRIGHLYHILSPGDSTTSINLPWIVEFYINFGLKGAVLGLGLVGFVLGGLAWIGTVGARSAILPIFTIGILLPLSYQESNISLMVGNALHGAVGAVGLIAIAWVARRHREKTNNRAPST
jgi:hypothetical protein